MASAAGQYTTEVGRELRFTPTWTPGTLMTLGDIGYLDDDNVFARSTSLVNFGIRLPEAPTGSGEEAFAHASAGAVEYGFKARGETSALVPNVPAAEAGIGVRFLREHASVFRAEGARHHRFDDETRLRDEIVSLIRKGSWDREWVVVTHVVEARSTTALVSRAAGAGMEFSVTADIGAGGLELLTADVGLRTVASREMQTIVVGTGGATPLFRAHRVRRRWFSGQVELRATFSDDLARAVDDEEDDEIDLFEDVPLYGSRARA